VVEYITEAVVLNREPSGDLDSRFSLFTNRFGKLVAKGKSTRRPTSKLSSHLEPGMLVQVRLIEKNGLQVVDALKRGEIPAAPPSLHFLDRILPEAEPEPDLWRLLLTGLNWRSALAILGWDPKEALCATCSKGELRAFSVRSQEFFCSDCVSKHRGNEVLYID